MSCANCNGKGQIPNPFGFAERCTTCNGSGKTKCTACEGTGVNQTFADDHLRTIIRGELWAVEQLSGGDASAKKGADDTRWSSILQSRQLSPVAGLNLETISEFDPRKCVFRNGAWKAP